MALFMKGGFMKFEDVIAISVTNHLLIRFERELFLYQFTMFCYIQKRIYCHSQIFRQDLLIDFYTIMFIYISIFY